jgi:hypothetical protein
MKLLCMLNKHQIMENVRLALCYQTTELSAEFNSRPHYHHG